MVYGFNEADASDLKEIIDVFIAGGKTRDDAQDKPQISFNVFLTGIFVSLLNLLE